MSPPRSKPPGSLYPSGTQGIDQALRGSEVLASLTRRVQESQQRLLALQPLLPAAMQPQVKAGPIDDQGWTLLAGNPAVAAKLRQMLPALEARLRHCGWAGPAVRVKLKG